MNQKWYEKTIWIVVLLVLFFPLGLLLMWMKAKWSKRTKLIITGLFIFLLLIGAASDNGKSTQVNPTSSPIPSNSPKVSPKAPQTLEEKIKVQLGDGESFVIENAVNIDTNEPLAGKKQITITRNLGKDLWDLNMAKKTALSRDAKLTQNIFPLDDSIATLQITTNVPIIDVYGQNKMSELEFVIITRDTYSKIDWNNFDYNNISTIADSYFQSKNIK